MMATEKQAVKAKVPKANAPASPKFDELDGRYGVVKRLKRRADELFRLATKRDAITAQRCRRIALVERSVQDLETAAINGEGELDAVYVQKTQLLEKLYAQLGIEAGETKADLDDYLEEKRK